MTFKVIVSDPACVDMEEAADFIWSESPGNARRWLAECWQYIHSLSEMPFRHALIPEAVEIGLPYRSLPFGSHRLIYRVDEQLLVVYVVRVYHAARKPLTSSDDTESLPSLKGENWKKYLTGLFGAWKEGDPLWSDELIAERRKEAERERRDSSEIEL